MDRKVNHGPPHPSSPNTHPERAQRTLPSLCVLLWTVEGLTCYPTCTVMYLMYVNTAGTHSSWVREKQLFIDAPDQRPAGAVVRADGCSLCGWQIIPHRQRMVNNVFSLGRYKERGSYSFPFQRKGGNNSYTFETGQKGSWVLILTFWNVNLSLLAPYLSRWTSLLQPRDGSKF